MSTIGKVFTVLNLILAAAFLGWAANALKANADYKGKLDAEVKMHSADKSKLEADLAAVTADRAKIQKDLDTRGGEVRDMTSANDRLKATVAELTATGTKMQASLDKIALTLADIETAKTNLQAEKDKAEKAQREAEVARATADQSRGEADKTANQLKADLEKANNAIAGLEKDKAGLQKDRGALELQLDTLVANTGAKLADYAPVPEIKAGVLDVSMAVEPGIVALNVGSNKGVKRGYTFAIYDGKTYKGEARVEYVHPDMSSAIITSKVPGQTMLQGDSATTRL